MLNRNNSLDMQVTANTLTWVVPGIFNQDHKKKHRN